MTKQNQIYKCEICGNIVEILRSGKGQLICCNQSMNLLKEKQKDQGKEKHVPVIKKVKNISVVSVGEIEHPMNKNHYIEWIEIVLNNGKRIKRFLQPNDKPEIEYHCINKIVSARSYCNIHGLWKSKK